MPQQIIKLIKTMQKNYKCNFKGKFLEITTTHHSSGKNGLCLMKFEMFSRYTPKFDILFDYYWNPHFLVLFSMAN